MSYSMIPCPKYSEETIDDFITTFAGFGGHAEPNGKTPDGRQMYTLESPIIECFTNGCCYWFAVILNQRFKGSKIVYDPVVKHFACKIGNAIYDIRGNIDKYYGPGFFQWYDWDTWEVYENGSYSKARLRVINDCVLKLNNNKEE